jgi:hypothetical protein
MDTSYKRGVEAVKECLLKKIVDEQNEKNIRDLQILK